MLLAFHAPPFGIRPDRSDAPQLRLVVDVLVGNLVHFLLSPSELGYPAASVDPALLMLL
jgi:hypothetical protein